MPRHQPSRKELERRIAAARELKERHCGGVEVTTDRQGKIIGKTDTRTAESRARRQEKGK